MGSPSSTIHLKTSAEYCCFNLCRAMKTFFIVLCLVTALSASLPGGLRYPRYYGGFEPDGIKSENCFGLCDDHKICAKDNNCRDSKKWAVCVLDCQAEYDNIDACLMYDWVACDAALRKVFKLKRTRA